jgi:flavin-dependent dehydrogenase
MFSDTGKHWQATVQKKPFYNTFVPHRWLADRYEAAKKVGAPFLANTLALKVKQTSKEVELTVRTNGKTKTLTCKKLIASDGLSSRIAHFMGIKSKRTLFGKGPTIEYEMTNLNCPYDRGDMFFFGENNFGGTPGGIIMIPSPNGKNAFRIETMSVMPAYSASEMIEFFINKSPFASWFKKAKIIEKSGAMVEMMTPLRTPNVGNVLFVGDSAAFGECLYQGATMCGYMGGVCTEQELRGKQGFEEYTRWWIDSYEWNKDPKRMADYMKRVLFPRFFSRKEMDFLFDLAAKNPIVVDEADATPYDYTKVVMEQFLAMDEVQGELRERMQEIIDADMATISSVFGKAQRKD